MAVRVQFHKCVLSACAGEYKDDKVIPISENLVYYYEKNGLEKDEIGSRVIDPTLTISQ